jgi:glycosyltransferase involved in cell wall biosynthesis
MEGTTQTAPTTPREPQLLSVVAPMFNEIELVRAFYDRVTAAAGDAPLEIVISDNASTDGTSQALDLLAAEDPRVKVVHLARNFGHQASLTAGLEHASGDVVVMIDGDLQDPPELIPTMLDHWANGADVVYAVREERQGETRWKLGTARAFYWVFEKLTSVDLHRNSGDFRLLDRRALDALLQMPERNRFLRGMTSWLGFKQVGVSYRRDARAAGETKYSVRELIRFSFDAIVSFSHRPLQLATVMGFIVSAIAFLGIPIAIGLKIAGEFVPGITSVLLAVLLLGGIQLITVGIIGEYLGRVYDEVKQRPLYVVRERVNIAGPVRDSRAIEAHAEIRER